MNSPLRHALLLISLASFGGGFFLSLSYPFSSFLAATLFLGAFLLSLYKPLYGFLSLITLLPVLNFSPWTGWLIVDEFDLLVSAVVAAGYFRLWKKKTLLESGLTLLLSLTVVVALMARSTGDMSLSAIDPFSGYLSPANSFRIGKSLLWAVLLYPLLIEPCRCQSRFQAMDGFFKACLGGVLIVVVAVFWERAFFPGLLDVSTPYRTVALFWEMHLGGAALDIYLVLVAPLLVWAWRSSRSTVLRSLCGAFILAFVYACLTTFSRGVVGAIAGSLVILFALFAIRPKSVHVPVPQSRGGGLLILFLVFLEVVAVLGSDSFMNKRLATSEKDLSARWEHWAQGIGLLDTPGEWMFGIGLGQLPSRLRQAESGPALPGDYFRVDAAEASGIILTGPDRDIPGGLFAISQRIDLFPGRPYRISMDVRSSRETDLLAQVCAIHLLYPKKCQFLRFHLKPGDWQHYETGFFGKPFDISSWLRFGHGAFSISVLTPGAVVELKHLRLAAGNVELLRNPEFVNDTANWFPIGQAYFLPWHIDNLYLEILIETGLAGLGTFLGLIVVTLWRLLGACRSGDPVAPYFISSISGLLALGLVVSVFDMPRVAWFFLAWVLLAWRFCCRKDEAG